jgi:hypothetical protein
LLKAHFWGEIALEPFVHIAEAIFETHTVYNTPFVSKSLM